MVHSFRIYSTVRFTFVPSFMYDNQLIKEKYASMPDELLLSIAREETDQLTDEAKVFLEEEIRKRNLLVGSKEESILRDIKLNKEDIQFALEQIESRKSDEIVLALLTERGLTEEEISNLLNQLPFHISQRIQKSEQALVGGLALFVSGFAISFIQVAQDLRLLMSILAYSAIFIGAIRILHGFFYMRKYKQVRKMLH